MVGFIQRSSDPSQPGRALDKKNLKITQFFLCLYYLYNHQIWRELWRKIDICFFKVLCWTKWKSKCLTNSRDFYPYKYCPEIIKLIHLRIGFWSSGPKCTLALCCFKRLRVLWYIYIVINLFTCPLCPCSHLS